jgi:hypothetical protein
MGKHQTAIQIHPEIDHVKNPNLNSFLCSALTNFILLNAALLFSFF